eukprot:GHVU01077647.1.p1 GENE.GHVU01077647.1~~GHVU01077647.1.p1  ORF type:complete len:226 (+),score=58.84 GHVU01077647.1:44-679(+)
MSNTPVIICHNLSAEGSSVQKLFNLFSLFGNVTRVKILRDKPDTAMVQFSQALYATVAYNLLKGCEYFGKEIQIAYSKNQEVKMPPSNILEQGEDLAQAKTRAFTSRDQRYGSGEAMDKYLKAACRPTNTLFVANINEAVSIEEVISAISQHGRVWKYEVRPPKEGGTRKTAIIEMASQMEAMVALCHLHDTKIKEKGDSVKLAFSKTVLQ